MKVKKENFELKKFKKTEAGIMVQFNEKSVLSNGVESKCLTTKTFKDDPQKELVDALEAFDEIVKYDEGYSDKTEIKITGITVFPEIECGIITHLKTSISGKGAKNSGRISKESEEFKLAKKFFDLIDILSDEVYDYVFNGKRAQLALWENNDEEGEEDDVEEVAQGPGPVPSFKKKMEVA